MGKVTNIFKKYLISTHFHDLSMTSKYILTRNYHNKSALSSPYPSLVYLFFKKSRLAYKTLLKIEQQKYDFIRHTKGR